MQKNKPNSPRRILVIGSIAYDHLLKYDGLFSQKILPKNIRHLSLSLLVAEHRINFGGCGANIAYHFKKSGENPMLVGLVGRDFQKCGKWLRENKIDTSYIMQDKNFFTAAAYILTDRSGAQITFFDPGVSRTFSPARFPKLRNIHFAVIAPAALGLMRYGMEVCRKNRIPYFFDPGQMVHNFSSSELKSHIGESAGIFMNEYETRLLLKKTKWNMAKLKNSCPLVVETLAEKGSRIFWMEKQIDIPSIRPKKIVNPTGCGDAYRAGFLAELKKTYPDFTLNNLRKAGRQGSRLASRVIGKISR